MEDGKTNPDYADWNILLRDLANALLVRDPQLRELSDEDLALFQRLVFHLRDDDRWDPGFSSL
jgi:hypothetical protein